MYNKITVFQVVSIPIEYNGDCYLEGEFEEYHQALSLISDYADKSSMIIFEKIEQAPNYIHKFQFLSSVRPSIIEHCCNEGIHCEFSTFERIAWLSKSICY